MVKVYVFDLDGTLIDSHEAHARAYIKVFSKRGLTVNKRVLVKNFGKTSENIIKELFPQLDSSEVEQIARDKKNEYLKMIDLVTRQSCADKILSKAKSKGKLALATSSSRIELNKILKMFKWYELFDLRVSSYDVAKPKPAPDLLLKIINSLKVKPINCLFIGDSIYDALAAKSAGIEFIGVTTGSFSKKAFKEHGFKSYPTLCEIYSLIA
ncbi:MAG: HAD family hydrolase [Promethearchaeota archaeon]|nr:MAG: HAD family hydrolase [Candidatus Lokiarchaeota archaeon]